MVELCLWHPLSPHFEINSPVSLNNVNIQGVATKLCLSCYFKHTFSLESWISYIHEIFL